MNFEDGNVLIWKIASTDSILFFFFFEKKKKEFHSWCYSHCFPAKPWLVHSERVPHSVIDLENEVSLEALRTVVLN